MRSIELFSGAGGLALGTHRAGFHHLAVVERDHDACDTLRLNRERRAVTGIDWPIAETDVKAFDYAPYRVSGDIDLLAGGAPCQPFSLGGKHAGEADPRNMFPEVLRAVRELQPRAVLLENVRGIVRENFKSYFDYILAQLALPFIRQHPNELWQDHAKRLESMRAFTDRMDETYHYDVAWQLVNVADFGVPQERQRVFVVAFRTDLNVRWSFPAVTHAQDALLYSQYVDARYWEEHSLRAPSVPERMKIRVARLAKLGKPMSPRWRTVRDAIQDLPEPIEYDSSPLLDNHVGIPDARSYPGHTGSPWDWPAKAIKAGDHGNPGGENMLRHDDGTVRYFTVRELARIQTFPDEWHFANSWTESRRQLGNAVPVAMAELLARAIYYELERIDCPEPLYLREQTTMRTEQLS